MDDLVRKINTLELSSDSSTGKPDKPKLRPVTPPKEPWKSIGSPTGLFWDDTMIKHKCLWVEADESPQRYECIRDRFNFYNLAEKCMKFPGRLASEEEILLLHDKDYYDLVKSTQGEKDVDKLKAICEKYDGVYMNEYTYECAMMAAGSSIDLCDYVLDGKLKNGFALIRTPGHHAQRAEPNGYCIFNNAALAAKHAVEKRGLERVLIIDWDVHHGQGTQSFFYDDPHVMYVSSHRYENGTFWPELIESNFNFIGSGHGKGYNINIPLNQTGCTDGDFLMLWFNLVMPVAYSFDPQLIIISAGYDAAIGCPEGQMRVKPVTFYTLCHSLMALANGKVVALLEGGYMPASLAESAAMTLRALLGQPCPPLDTDTIVEMRVSESVKRTCLDCIWALRPHWPILSLQGKFDRFAPESGADPRAGGDVQTRLKYAPVAIYEGTNPTSSESRPEKFDLMGVCCPKNAELQAALLVEIEDIKRRTDMSLPEDYPSKRTSLATADVMLMHKDKSKHPECPERYQSIRDRLDDTGLTDICGKVAFRKASDEELELVHDRALIDRLRATSFAPDKTVDKYARKLDSIYINKHTFSAAQVAAGLTLEAVDMVMESEHRTNAFCVIRPPGHHADGQVPSGFCFFNNTVLGARYAQKKYAHKIRKVLIVDYDYHHGNGVQTLVEGDESILYVSVHGYDHGAAYPGDLGNYNSGHKNIINIPWNDDKMADTEYIMAWLAVVMPCAYEFNPDLVLVSSGFDAARKDPLGLYDVSPQAFGHLVHHLMPLANGRIVCCLEGGYNLKSISEASAHVVSILAGAAPMTISQGRALSSAAIGSLQNVISYHKSNYAMLCLDYDLPTDQISD